MSLPKELLGIISETDWLVLNDFKFVMATNAAWLESAPVMVETYDKQKISVSLGCYRQDINKQCVLVNLPRRLYLTCNYKTRVLAWIQSLYYCPDKVLEKFPEICREISLE